MMAQKKENRPSRHRRFIATLYAVSFAAIAWFLIDGYTYYTMAYGQRPRHENYSALKPAGSYGHAFGIIGTAMMIFMLLYSLRKRTRMFGKLGNLRHWLDVHIYFGIIGPLLVVLHTSFKIQGLVSVSFWSMIAVALSGVLGRYLYLQIPRDFEGDSLNLHELNRTIEQMTSKAQEEGVLSAKEFDLIEYELSWRFTRSGNTMLSLLLALTDDIARPFRIRRVRKKYTARFKIPVDRRDQIFDLAIRKSILRRKMAILDQVQQLFHYWHVFHKPFAIIMYIIMVVHVAVAVWLGYTWIL